MSPTQPSSGGTRRQAAHSAVALAALVAGLGLGLAPGRAAHAASSYDWRLVRNGAAGQPVHSGTPLRLVNVTIAKVLVYGARDYGINLVWQNAAGQQNVRFYKVGGGPIRYGDRLALYIEGEGGGFVRYGERDHGINLVWSGSAGAVYEWELVGGTAGTQVLSGSDRSHVLRNTTVPATSARRRALVYGARDQGIDLVWFSG